MDDPHYSYNQVTRCLFEIFNEKRKFLIATTLVQRDNFLGTQQATGIVVPKTKIELEFIMCYGSEVEQ